MQNEQNTAGSLSLRSARSGTKFATNRSLSTDGRPSACLCICLFCITKYKFLVVSQLPSNKKELVY